MIASNKNTITVFDQYYPGSSDNNFGAVFTYRNAITLTTNWRRYNLDIEFPSFDTVRAGSDQSTVGYLRFLMDDQTVNYDWEIGGIMVATRAPYFDLTPYTE